MSQASFVFTTTQKSNGQMFRKTRYQKVSRASHDGNFKSEGKRAVIRNKNNTRLIKYVHCREMILRALYQLSITMTTVERSKGQLL